MAIPIRTFGDLIGIYQTHCKDIHKNTINMGFPTLHKSMRGLRKGELMTVLAKTGVGKSILTLNFTLNFILQHSEEIAIIVSLEMNESSLAERMMQILLKLSGDEVEKAFLEDNSMIIDVAKSYVTNLEDLLVINQRLDVNDIPNIIRQTEKQRNKKVSLLIIDHVSILKNRDFTRDPYGRITDNMVKLYDMAKYLNLAVINVSQISREEGKKDSLTVYAGKESGEVENSSDFLVAIELVNSNTTRENEVGMIEAIRRYKPGRYCLMKLTFLKTRRNKIEPLYVLFDTKTILMHEYNNKTLTS